MPGQKKVILHIAAYYSGSAIYRQLVSTLSSIGFRQLVYAPIRSKAELGENAVEDPTVTLKYDVILKRSDRLLFGKKIKKLWRRINKSFDLTTVDMVHAHTLFSDGAVALKMYQKLQTPYIIAVRNTDLNIFWKYMPHLRPLGRKILRHADQVIFLNQAYKDSLIEKLPAHERKMVLEKAVILPNGINQYWHDKVAQPKAIKRNVLSFLYIGDYSINKNVPLLMDFVKYVAETESDFTVRLNLVGGGSSRGRHNVDAGIATRLEGTLPPNLIIAEHGKITSADSLRELYRQADFFAMLSKRETFGLVYAEALSQGTPIIYTQGQGISSYFKNSEVGLAVDISKESHKTVYENLQYIIDNYEKVSTNCIDNVQRFNWSDIGEQYKAIYAKAIEQKL